MKYQFMNDVQELLELPFVFAEIPRRNKTAGDYSFFDQACSTIGNNIEMNDTNAGGKAMKYCLIKGLQNVYLHRVGKVVDQDNYVSIFLKYYDRCIENDVKIGCISISFGKDATFFFQNSKPKILSTISLSKTVQIFRDYLALKEKKIKEPTIEQFCENEKRMKELEAQLATLKEENEKLKIKNNKISKVISGM